MKKYKKLQLIEDEIKSCGRLSIVSLMTSILLGFISVFINLLLPISLIFGFLAIMLSIKFNALQITRIIIKGAKKWIFGCFGY